MILKWWRHPCGGLGGGVTSNLALRSLNCKQTYYKKNKQTHKYQDCHVIVRTLLLAVVLFIQSLSNAISMLSNKKNKKVEQECTEFVLDERNYNGGTREECIRDNVNGKGSLTKQKK